jgi:MtfA peptidase
MGVSTALHLLAIILFLLLTFRVLRNIWSLFTVPSNEKLQLHNFYKTYSHYYNQLTPPLQNRFVYRASSLSKSVKIIGRQGFVVNQKAKLMVLSAMVQLTFGFRNYSLPRFRTIFVYPGTYTSPVTGQKHDGEVHPQGLIVLSWEKLVKGYADPHDKINLGLHEMAHALMHTILYTNRHEPGLNDYLDNVLKLSANEIQKIKNGDYHIFRPYAGSSINEFFAVAIEHFFEDPNSLNQNLPSLYQKLCMLLKQNPAKGIFVMSNNP